MPTTNLPQRKIVKTISYLIIGLFASIIYSYVSIEFTWFSQFNLESLIIKRWLISTLTLFFSLSLICGCLLWEKKWRLLITNEAQKKEQTSKIYGNKYTAFIILSFTINSILLTLLTRISIISLTQPSSIGHWWSIEFKYNILIFLLYFTFLSFSLLFKSILKYIQILGYCLFSYIFYRSWYLWILAINIPKTNISEPLFESDISFALSQYPAYSLILLLVIIILTITGVNGFIFFLTYSTKLSEWNTNNLTIKERNHLRPLVFLVASIGSCLLWLSRYNFLWVDNGMFSGAGWLDIRFNIPIRTTAAFSLFIFAILILLSSKYIFKRRAIRTISFGLFILSLITEIIFTPFLEWILVKPRELSLQSKYINHSIKATRKAFQLDSIKTRLLNPNNKLTKRDIDLAKSTLRNIRLWDSQPLLATNSQLQQLRVYYRFSNVAIDRYQLRPNSSERQQVMITARELDQDALPNRSKTWLNKHFVFTHGYGFTMSPVNTKAKDGLPEYFISNLGSSTKIEGNNVLGIAKNDVASAIPLGNGSLYFGILPSPYAVVPSLIQELDYPEGEVNIYNHYEGNAGIPLTNLWQRIKAAIYLREPRLLNTGSLTKNSRLLIKRGIKNRVKYLAPFLELIGDPYLIAVKPNGNNKEYSNNQYLYWIVEAYTTSRSYPYASNLPDGNPLRYIRNSAKAVVDAYTGKVKIYITEPEDPIIRGWQKLFPELFSQLNNMPKTIKEHLRVPTDLFEIKVQQLLRYHVTDPRTFYNGDDVWQVPKELYGKTQIPVDPYHITAQLGPNEKSEFLLLQPLTPIARPNLSAWLAARNDGKYYGELILLRFPSQATVLGPEQIQALINQDPEISKQFSLWDRAGSEVIQGNLLVVPVGRSLLYVEPVYLKASQGGLPTLTRVVVSDGKSIAMTKDLSEGINKLLEKN